MVAQGSSTVNARTALHTTVWAVSGDVKTSYATLAELKADPAVDIQELGFDQRVTRVRDVNASLADGASAMPFRAAVALRDDGIDLANSVNRSLLSGQAQAAALRPDMLDKEAVFRTLTTAGVAVPHYRVARTEADLVRALASGEFEQGRYVVKPARGLSSESVYRSEDGESPIESLQAFLETGGHDSLAAVGPLIIMEYIDLDGIPVEFALDGFVLRGDLVFSAVHEKTRQVENPFRDLQMICPVASPVAIDAEASVRSLAAEVVRSLGLETGSIHFEFRMSSAGPLPIDLAFRFGGGFVPHAIEQVYGVDLRLLHFLSHLDGFQASPDDSPAVQAALAASEPKCATCIGVLYASPETDVTPAMLEELGRDLSAEYVFASNVRPSLVTDPLWKSDVALSFGVRGESADEARGRFTRIAEKYSFE